MYHKRGIGQEQNVLTLTDIIYDAMDIFFNSSMRSVSGEHVIISEFNFF